MNKVLITSQFIIKPPHQRKMETFGHLHIHGQETMNYHGSEVCAHIGKSSQSFGCASILSSSVVDTNQ